MKRTEIAPPGGFSPIANNYDWSIGPDPHIETAPPGGFGAYDDGPGPK